MEAPAGWYDAGVPDRQRWWDGAQWTQYERDAPPPVSQPAVQPLALPQPVQPAHIPAGWYAVPGSGEVRWRDDQHWTAYRVANGRPGANWYATEPPLIGYVFGGLFLMLGIAQGGLAVLSGNPTNAILMLLLGLFWLSAGIGGSIVRGKPAPVTAPLVPEHAQPLPWQAEGPGAGWYPVSARVSRWWSGVRWGSYVSESNRVRPTFGGPKLYRVMRIMAWVVIGVGAFGVVAGMALIAVFGALPFLPGVLTLIVGLMLALLGGILFPVIAYRRPSLLLPEHPPAR